MTERTVEPLRLAKLATVATSIFTLAACAGSEPSSSTATTTPESSTESPGPAAEEPHHANRHPEAQPPEQPPAHAGTEDPPASEAPEAPAPQGGGGAPADSGSASSVTDDELEAFVDVQLELEAVRRELLTEAEQQPDADAAELRRQLEQRAEEAVEESSLSLTRYQKIGQRLMRDPDLQQRARDVMEEQSGG